ncbi:PKD domain-containing protein [Cesiribacter sp. SM1]|uniref:PKD domain-containing protein n=1 Tax=Cesiribacter sp. SM1 TaxID=2861196 RepID=UPI001CD81686|nr:PKD domain-containing protein [Cesiribacter sp. SM1]
MKANQIIKQWCFLLLLSFFIACDDDDSEPAPVYTLEAVASATPTEVAVGETVQLNGASSKDPGQIGYTSLWTVTAKPNGSTASIQNASAANASFVPDMAGAYELTLTISNADKNVSSTAKVNITATASLVVLSENITADLVLENIFTDPDVPDYLVTAFIEVRAKLTIRPGVVIHFERNAGLHITETGTLVANGTEAEKIIFTGENEEQGYWLGIRTRSETANNSISHAEIHYAGSMNAGTFLQKAALSPEYTTISLDNILITNSGGYGIQTREEESILNLSNITFEDNAGSPLYIHPEQIAFIDEDSDFGGGYVEVYTGSTRNTGAAMNWVNPKNGKYLISADLTVNRAVSIAPGTVFEAADGVLITISDHAESRIVASGTADNPIVFTSKTKEQGAWRGILVNSSADQNLMEYVTIENGGSSRQATFVEPANLGIGWVTKLTLNNVHIANSAGYGIYVRDNPSDIVLTMNGVTYDSNALNDFKVEE